MQVNTCMCQCLPYLAVLCRSGALALNSACGTCRSVRLVGCLSLKPRPYSLTGSRLRDGLSASRLSTQSHSGLGRRRCGTGRYQKQRQRHTSQRQCQNAHVRLPDNLLSAGVSVTEIHFVA